MNTLPTAKKAAVLKALIEGASIRAAARMTGVSKTTILKLLVEVGEFCRVYQDYRLRQLPCRKIQADEIWGFIGAKRLNAKQQGHGDVWTFVAIDPESKLVASWAVGHRIPSHFDAFMRDLHGRLAHRIQLSTDGHGLYLAAVEKSFGWNVDYAQLVKHYGQPLEVPEGPARRYSPPICLGTTKTWVSGEPNDADVSTSHVERANLSIRMNVRRMTRLTNGFSKKMENHAHAIALHFFAANFCRAHLTLTKQAGGIHTSPAMATGLTDHVWTIEEMLVMMDSAQPIR